MFKFRAETGVSAETIRGEAKQGARSLRTAQARAKKQGKKLSNKSIIVQFFKDQPNLRKILDARGAQGNITSRGIGGKKNQRLLAGKKSNARSERQLARVIQRRDPKAAAEALKALQTPEGKAAIRAIKAEGGGRRIAFALQTLRKRAKGQDVAKIKPRPGTEPEKPAKKPRKK